MNNKTLQELALALATAKVGQKVPLKGKKYLQVTPCEQYSQISRSPCSYCYFKEDDACNCPMAHTCMAHLRGDGMSVIYKLTNA